VALSGSRYARFGWFLPIARLSWLKNAPLPCVGSVVVDVTEIVEVD
jgi:hypothetical protein